MKVCFFVKDDSFISKALLDSFLQKPQIQSSLIFCLDGKRRSALNLWLRYFIQKTAKHPDLMKTISSKNDVHLIKSINSEEVINKVIGYKPDHLFLLGYPEILTAPTLRALGNVINYHNSFLPYYRGVFATHRALLDEKESTGFSFHRVDRGIDTGPIYYQEEVVLNKNKSALQNELIIIKRACQSIDKFLVILDKNTEPKIQKIKGELMSATDFHKKLDDRSSGGVEEIKKIISICGGYAMQSQSGKKQYVTKLSATGKVKEVKGLPLMLYKLLNLLKIIQ